MPSFQFACGLVLVAAFAVWIWRMRATVRACFTHIDEETSRGLFEQPFIGYLEIDCHGNIQRVNGRECELRGMHQEALLQKNLAELSADPGQVLEELERRCRHHEVPPAYRASYVRSDGSTLIIEVQETLLCDRSGRVAGIRYASLDVTDRHRMEATASASTSELNALFQVFPDLCLRLSIDGNILDSRGGQDSDPILRPATYAGKRLQDVVNKATSSRCLEAMSRIRTTGGTQTIDCSERGPSGERVYEIRLVPLAWDHFMAIIRNITEARATEARLTSYAQELEAKNQQLETAMATAREAIRLKSRFLANISHEIRTPLNGVFGMIDLLQSTMLSNEQREYMQTLRESAAALLPIINDILDLAKMEAGKLRLERNPFNLRALVAQVVSLYQKRAQSKGLQFSTDFPPSVPESVVGDVNRLRQILCNLLDNAVKFTDQGSVKLQLNLEQGAAGQIGLRFSISDTGIGVAADQRERIFESFTQGDGSASRKYGGTGLGLAISKHLVELLGGEIGVESEPGEGSTFWFTAVLELADAATAETHAATAAPRDRSSALRPARVLVAEDNELNKKLSLRLLGKLGIEADAVSDGREAVEAATKKSYDMILMDCQMPEMDGFEATAIIREKERNRRHTPICALTANAMDGDRDRCLAAGMDDYLCKPIGLDQLRGVVQRWIADSVNLSA